MNQMGMDPRLTGVEESIPLRPLAVFGNTTQRSAYHSSYKMVGGPGSGNYLHPNSEYVPSWAGESNGSVGAERLSHSLPGSPADRKPNFEVIGSAESLVGRVLVEQGLGKYCDPEFVRYTSREMQEALDMTREEMDRAAHQLLLQERRSQSFRYHQQQQPQQQQPQQQQPDMVQQWNPAYQQPIGIGYQPLQEQPPSGTQRTFHHQPSYHRQGQQQQQQQQPPS